MKLRIQGNSLRLRISQSELARFTESGQLEDTIHFGPAKGSSLTYLLRRDPHRHLLDVEASPGRLSVLVPADTSHAWASTDQVGISGDVDLGVLGTLSVLVEKDFACLDRSSAENGDTFPNPHLPQSC